MATVGQTASYLAIAVRGLLVACGVVLLAFYWSLQGDRTVRWVSLLLPVAGRDGARDTIAEIESKVGVYRGRAWSAWPWPPPPQRSMASWGFVMPLFWGLSPVSWRCCRCSDPFFGAIPPLGVAMFTSPGKTPWVLLAAVLMQQVEGYLLVPRVMDKSVGVHPLVTLLAITAFGSVFGVGGAILAIPLAAIIQVILNRYLLGPAASEPQQPSGRGALSILRYDTQQLLRDVGSAMGSEPPAGKTARLGEAIEAIARDLDAEVRQFEGPGEAEDGP